MPTILMRLSVHPDPNRPRFEEARWIISEDINVEHLLNFVTSIDRKAIGVWDTCVHFLEYLCWQKPRQTVLRSKIKGLPNGVMNMVIFRTIFFELLVFFTFTLLTFHFAC